MLRYYLLLPMAKGIVMVGVIEQVVEVSFLQTLAVACVSALLSGVFLLIATHMNLKRAVRPTEQIQRSLDKKLDTIVDAEVER